jgi:hypothetical protein
MREEAAVFSTDEPLERPAVSLAKEPTEYPAVLPTKESPEHPTTPFAKELPEPPGVPDVAADATESLAEEEGISPLQQARDAGDLVRGWELASQELQLRIFREDFDALRGIRLLTWSDSQAMIGCLSLQQKRLIEDRMMGALRQSLDVPLVQCYLVQRQ